jgi:hypothetical protein
VASCLLALSRHETDREIEPSSIDGRPYLWLRLKLKFIGPKAVLPLLTCVREGYRTERVGVPSLYQFTDVFIQFMDLHDNL